MKTTCPCCGREVFDRSTSCIHCGYRSDAEDFRGFLRALSTVSSILAGFCLAGLVDLTGVEPESTVRWWSWTVTSGCWLAAAVVFLVTVFGSESILRRGWPIIGLRLQGSGRDVLDRQCSWLLAVFLFAVALMVAGLIALALYYSIWHAVMAGLATVGGGVFFFVVLQPGSAPADTHDISRPGD